jgi:hypothetical protein
MNPKQGLRYALRFLIVIVIAFQVYWYLAPRNWAMPMSEQTIKAFRAEANPPTAADEAAVHYQVGRDSDHHKRQHRMVGISLVLLDGIVIYFFWNCASMKGVNPGKLNGI